MDSINNGYQTSPEPQIASGLLCLISPYGNCEVYRQYFEQAPGIPFLVPHIRESREYGDQVLRDLFQRMRSYPPVYTPLFDSGHIGVDHLI